jgi:hypothetical protein
MSEPQDGNRSRADEHAASDPAPLATRDVEPAGPRDVPARPAAGQAVAAGFVGGAVAAAAVAGAMLLWGPLAELPRRLDAVEANAGAAAPRSALDALDKRAATLEQKAGALSAALEPVARQSEAAELAAKDAAAKAAAATSLASQAKSAAEAAPSASAGTPSTDAAAYAARLGTVEGSLAKLDSLGQRVAASEAGLAKLAGQPAASQAAADDLAAKLASLQQKLGQVAQDDAQAAGSLVSVALLTRQDLAAGKPLAKPLLALKALGAPGAELAALSVYADTAPPSTAELSASLADLMRRTAPKPAAPETTGSIWDRVASQASHLVKVHPVGQPAPVEDVAEVQAALAAGRLGDAVATWEKLPPDIRQRTQAWADQAHARLAAAQAADSLVASSVDRLASASPTTGAPSR